MKTTKILSVIAALSIASSAFADVTTYGSLTKSPQSKTNIATAGTVTFEADNLVDVNGWSGVQTGNVLTYTGFDSATNIDLAFAKAFNKMYCAGYFYGNLMNNLVKTDSTTVTTSAGTDLTDSETVLFNSINSTILDNLSFLFGIGNWGFKGTVDFSGYYSSSDTKDNLTGATVPDSTTTNNFLRVTPVLEGGTTVALGKITLTPHFLASFIFAPQTTTTKKINSSNVTTTTTTEYVVNGGTTTYSKNILALGAGTGIDLGGDTVKQFVNADLLAQIIFSPETISSNDTTSTVINMKQNAFLVSLDPSYVVQFQAAENIKVNFKVTSPMEVSYYSHEHQITTATVAGVTTTTYDTVASSDQLIFEVMPTFAIGLSHTIKPDTFILNFGVKSSIGDFVIKNASTTKDRTASSSDETTNYSDVKKDTTVSIGTIANVLSIGFTYLPAKNISIDAAAMLSQMNPSLNTFWTSLFSIQAIIKF